MKNGFADDAYSNGPRMQGEIRPELPPGMKYVKWSNAAVGGSISRLAGGGMFAYWSTCRLRISFGNRVPACRPREISLMTTRIKLKTFLRMSAALVFGHWGDVLCAQTRTLATTSVLPSAPSGFSEGAMAFPVGGGVGESILEGFGIAATLSETYSSNITQSPGLPVAPILDDFITSLGTNIKYLSKAADWTFGGNYIGSYNEYFNQSDRSGLNQSGGLVANYEGARLSASLNSDISFENGANRYYSLGSNSSNFVQTTNLNTRLSARYRISPKTTLAGDIGQSFSDASGGNFQNTSSYSLGVSALWKYSPLTEVGPGIRYTYSSGSSQLERTAVGPTLTVNYKLSKKVTMNSRVGMDFASYGDGTKLDPTVSASIGLNYQASRLWGMDFSLYRDSQADPTLAGAFTQVTALRLGGHRKIRRATLNLGLNYETNVAENSGNAAVVRPDRDYFSFDGSLGMAVFSNSCYASVFMRYNNQSSTDVAYSWDSFQTGFSISRSF